MFYAGIGSRETPDLVYIKMKEIATILESKGYTLRSGGARGADSAFESGVTNNSNKRIYLPKKYFNGRTHDGNSYIFIDEDDKDYRDAYCSLIHHPSGFNMKLHTRSMMIRNYFQVIGHKGLDNSSFVLCWTPDATNGYSVKTSRDSGGTGQAIRISASKNIPVYNLKDERYSGLGSKEFVDIVLENLDSGINPDVINIMTTHSLF